MVEVDCRQKAVNILSIEEWLSRAQDLVPRALDIAREVKGFPGKWKAIISRLEQIPSRLSDLSSHPCFSKNSLCKEQLHAVFETLNEVIEMAEPCVEEKYEGKLRMQSDLDALAGKLDLNLRDCRLLIKTGVLGEVTLSQPEAAACQDIRELLARLQIGDLEAKHKALDSIVEIMKEDETNLLDIMGRSNIAALIQLLNTTSGRIREKTVYVICSLVESGTCENWLVSEGVIPPLIRLVDSGSPVTKDKATSALQKLSMSVETARSIVEHGGAMPLIEICRNGDSVSQAASACTLRNISVVPELTEALAEDGIVKVMVTLLDCGILLGSKEYAADCLQNLTSNQENLKRSVISEGGLKSLLTYLDTSLPQESAIGALKNLIGLVPMDAIIPLNLPPRLVRALESGSPVTRLAAALTIREICISTETKRSVGEAGCIPHLVKMLEAKGNDEREAAARAIDGLMTLSCSRKEVKKEVKSVPNLVALLDPSPKNAAKRDAVSCLTALALSEKCKKLMVSYGAIGYLKKLTEMDVPGAKKLLERLERGKLKSLFSRK